MDSYASDTDSLSSLVPSSSDSQDGKAGVISPIELREALGTLAHLATNGYNDTMNTLAASINNVERLDQTKGVWPMRGYQYVLQSTETTRE